MHAPALRLAPLKSACSSCNLRELCLPVGLNSGELQKLDGLVAQRRTVPRGEHLFHNGERFEAPIPAFVLSSGNPQSLH